MRMVARGPLGSRLPDWCPAPRADFLAVWLAAPECRPAKEAPGSPAPDGRACARRPASPTQFIVIASATASPPPMHSVAMPRLPPVFRSAPIRVVRMRAPLAPIG